VNTFAIVHLNASQVQLIPIPELERALLAGGADPLGFAQAVLGAATRTAGLKRFEGNHQFGLRVQRIVPHQFEVELHAIRADAAEQADTHIDSSYSCRVIDILAHQINEAFDYGCFVHLARLDRANRGSRYLTPDYTHFGLVFTDI
jgi:hypothetical protein